MSLGSKTQRSCNFQKWKNNQEKNKNNKNYDDKEIKKKWIKTQLFIYPLIWISFIYLFIIVYVGWYWSNGTFHAT